MNLGAQENTNSTSASHQAMSSLVFIIVIYNYGLLFDKPPLRKLYHKDSVTSVKFDPSSGRAVVSTIADGQV